MGNKPLSHLINTGLYTFELVSDVPQVLSSAEMIYGDAETSSKPADFAAKIVFDSIVRRIIKPQVTFYSDQHSPFKPLPVSQATAVFEWGMNWCIAAHEFGKLIIHAAVLVKNGKAIIFPALPGSGKSTLTAYLGLSGWSTYSDEMAIIDIDSGLVLPMYRPVCLKNNSIDLVKSWYPDSQFTSTCKDTQKGDVAHVKVSNWSQYCSFEPVPIIGVVFPKYNADSELTIYQLSQLEAFATLSRNAFNYNVLGSRGFEAVHRVIQNSRHFEIKYNDVEEVNAFLTEDIIL